MNILRLYRDYSIQKVAEISYIAIYEKIVFELKNTDTNRIPLTGMSLEEMQQLFVALGEPKFRGDQLFNWVYNRQVRNFDLMTTFSKVLRSKLHETYSLQTLELAEEPLVSESGTKKLLFRTQSGDYIESVLIPEEERMTLCISSQAGCPLDCKFCATGLMGFRKNLTEGEILDQYLLSAQFADTPISNIVFMGMGEPLLNYDAVLKVLKIFGEELQTNISRKRITVSTAGIAPKIRALADSGFRGKIAFSLHSCFEDIRTQIMPINKKYSLAKNIDELRHFAHKTGTRITFEYVMLRGINDRKEDIKALCALTARLPSKINLIPFNSLNRMNPQGLSAELEPTPLKEINIFADALRNANITVLLRDTRGDDIAAACGQLAVKKDFTGAALS